MMVNTAVNTMGADKMMVDTKYTPGPATVS